MTREDAITLLRTHEPELHRLGATRLYLFGSVARDEARPSSDVDLFFDFEDPGFSLVELVTLQERIGDLLDTRADVTSRRSLHPQLRFEIEQAAIRVF